MVTKTRWRLAQSYERGYWRKRARQIEVGSSEQFDWYRWRSERLAERLTELGFEDVVSGDANVLEVGNGPVGMVSFVAASRAIGIDPLQSYFRSSDTLSRLRNPDVHYLKGVGEAVPVEDATIDLVIIDNCIDHVQSVGAVLGELERVLAPGGILFITVNCRTGVGYWVHRLLARLGADPGHPHTFTRRKIRMTVAERFEILHLVSESFLEAWRADLAASSVKAKAKGLLGTSEFVTQVVARKLAA